MTSKTSGINKLKKLNSNNPQIFLRFNSRLPVAYFSVVKIKKSSTGHRSTAVSDTDRDQISDFLYEYSVMYFVITHNNFTRVKMDTII